MMMASEVDGLDEGEVFVVWDDSEGVFGEDFVTEFALEAIDDFGFGWKVEAEEACAGFEF